ncbi:hypothetical protein [Desulfobacula sp.]|uniref:hypothetical protein n=1 Tax=Desulfobacula sp. TaxID=2593537 RepID=UPI0026095577|nr:hypothetical protein [Desulfobacula sp.]
MKKVVLMMIFIVGIIVSVSVVWAEAVGDVNGDGVVGMPEAISALQVSTGTRSALSTNIPTYNFSEYFNIDGAEYLYHEVWTSKSNDGTYNSSESDYFVKTTTESTGEQITYVQDWGDWVYYFSVINSVIVKIKEENFYQNPPTITTYSPPYAIGSTQMKVGDAFTTAFATNNSNPPVIREYTFLGLEDVATPAGTFQGCLKIRRVRSDRSGISLYYYAKNVGVVKEIYCYEDNGGIYELTAANIDGTTYGGELTSCTGTFTDSSTQATGHFRLGYVYAGTKYEGHLTVFSSPYSEQYDITSQDGITFTCPYPDPNFPGSFGSLTIQNGIISGTVDGWDQGVQYILNGTCGTDKQNK